jgi:hypothetical protein
MLNCTIALTSESQRSSWKLAGETCLSSGGLFSQRSRSLPESAPTTVQATEVVIRVQCRVPAFRLRESCIHFLEMRAKCPYLLVRSSFGGYNVRVFNGLCRDEVAGIVLADATQEDQYELLPKAWNAIRPAQLEHCERAPGNLERYAFFVVDLGIGRLMLRA